MNLNAIENLGNATAAETNPAQRQEAIRRAAAQFEAILLMQLTSALSGAGDDDENKLFGNDGGTNLAKQMFAEQLASTMADAGGIGLTDLIMRQFGLTQPQTTNAAGGLASIAAAVKDIRENPVSRSAGKSETAPSINKSSVIEPVRNTFSGDPSDAVVVSTFAEDIRINGIDESMRSLELNGKIVNSTRPRIVPDKAINEIQPVSSSGVSAASTKGLTEETSYQMPVAGRISSGFGNRLHPIDKVVKLHAGMDIAAPTGTPIGAAAEGVVTFAGWRKGYGKLVVIRHPDGRETRYGHASKIFVKENDLVDAGQQIAAVGSTGKSTGPHLHFELRENGQAVNPQKYLSNVLSK